MAKKREKKKINKIKVNINKKNTQCKSNPGCFYGLGFIGATIYYISTATGFWNGVLGVLKALVWPVFLVFELLKYLGA